jgi:putative transposase
MTKREGRTEPIDWRALLTADADFLRPLVEAVVQATLEAEMAEALGAAKGERTPARLGYRSGYYSRSLITRVGTLELRVPQTARADFRPRSSSVTSARRRRWSAPWRRCTCKAFRRAR